MNSKTGMVILNYKSKKLALKLASKLSIFPAVDHIVIVDNNSGDYFNDVEINSLKIEIIHNKENKGYSAGNNIGLKHLIYKHNCEYVYIANPDVDFSEETINVINNAFQKYPKLAVCSCLRYGFEGKKIHQYFDFQDFKNAAINCFFLGRILTNKNKVINQVNRIKYSVKNITFVDAVPGAFFGIRSSYLVESNFLFEGTFLYYEEFFIGKTVEQLGYSAGVVNTGIYFHNHLTSPLAKSNIKMFYQDRKSMLLYFKYFKLFGFFKLWLLFFLVVVGTIEYTILSYLLSMMKRVVKK
jgi:GT2 family glycosyltransferase